MKKFIPAIALSTYLLTPAVAFAQTSVSTCPPGQFNVLCGFTASSFGSVVSTLVSVLFVIAVVIALVFLIWGGIKWILSGGDKSAVESARNTIVAAVVGLIIVFLSYFILNIVLGFFDIKLADLKIPKINPAAPIETPETPSL
ncbi:MAG: hypothetical protein AAB521_01855 [Patescibacteria group bacterium]